MRQIQKNIFDAYIVYFFSDLKYNRKKKKKKKQRKKTPLFLFKTQSKSQEMLCGWDRKKTQEFKVKFLGCFPLNVQLNARYIHEKMP